MEIDYETTVTLDYGAPLETWEALINRLHLGEDLLPIICRPGAKIKGTSTLSKVGKVPSVWSDGQVVGLPEWTRLRATPAMLAHWQTLPDCGIGVQCRQVRGIDIDIDNYEIVNGIVSLASDVLGVPLVIRARPNSAKRLIMVRAEGMIGKRRMLHPEGCVELLGNGQQFVFAGTHESGEAYYIPRACKDGAPLKIHTVSIERLNDFWVRLCAKYGGGVVAPETQHSPRNSADTPPLMIMDPNLPHMHDLALKIGSEGQIYFHCPWKSEHTTDTGITSTAYFPAGTRGYARGHFACLHAHCSSRTDQEFLEALGIPHAAQEDFAPLTVLQAPPEHETRLTRRKDGRVEASLPNLVTVLKRPDLCGVHIRWDDFLGQVVFRKDQQEQGTGFLADAKKPRERSVAYEPPLHAEWKAWEDSEYTEIRLRLEKNGFCAIPRQLVVDAVHLTARNTRFDSAMDWLQSLGWDGTPRIATALSKYFGVVSSPYTVAVSMYMWTAFAGRVMEPGVKADMVPVLIGAQGVGKSYGLSALAPSADWYEEIDLRERDSDLSRKMRGKLVLEIGELRGMHSRELESLKSFLTRRFDSWIPKYQECAYTYPRRSLFIGTTNQPEFLVDSTGNRRWLPVVCGKVDIRGLARDSLQLWAEARECFSLVGVAWSEAQRLATKVHKRHRASDPWEETITQWILAPETLENCRVGDRMVVRLSTVMQDVLGIPTRSLRRADQIRVSEVFRNLGFESIRLDGMASWSCPVETVIRKALGMGTNNALHDSTKVV